MKCIITMWGDIAHMHAQVSANTYTQTHMHTHTNSALCWRNTVTRATLIRKQVWKSDCISIKGLFHQRVWFYASGLKAVSSHRAQFATSVITHITSSMIPLIWFWYWSSARWSLTPLTFWGEKIPEPVMQHVVVCCMSARVDSSGNAGNAKLFSGLLPRQQAMHGRRKMLWGEKRWGAHRGALTLLKW